MNQPQGVVPNAQQNPQVAMTNPAYYSAEAMNQYNSMVCNWSNYGYGYNMQAAGMNYMQLQQAYQQSLAQGQGYAQQMQLNQSMNTQNFNHLGLAMSNSSQQPLFSSVNPPLPPMPHPDEIGNTVINQVSIQPQPPPPQPPPPPPPEESINDSRKPNPPLPPTPPNYAVTSFKSQANLFERQIPDRVYEVPPPRKSPSPPPLTISPPPMPPTFPWICVSLFSILNDLPNSSDAEHPFNSSDTNDSFEDSQRKQDKLLNYVPDIYTNPTSNQCLPPELLDMFLPLHCNLCNLMLSSHIVAVDHYKGKKHKKRIDQWWEEHPRARRPTAASSGPMGRNFNGNNQWQSFDAGNEQRFPDQSGQDDGGENPWMVAKQNPFASYQGPNKDQRNSWGKPKEPDFPNRQGPPKFQRNDNSAVNNRDKARGASSLPLSGANAIPVGNSGPMKQKSDNNFPSNPSSSSNFQPKPLMDIVCAAPNEAPVSEVFRNPPNSGKVPPVRGPPKPDLPRVPPIGGKRQFGGAPPRNGPPPKKQNFPGSGVPKNNVRPSAPMVQPGNSATQFGFCNICKVTLGSKSTADQHYAGKRHREALNQQRGGQMPN